MPSAEILTVGTELLLGHVLDTNSQFLSEGLARLGIDCYYHSTVGDNEERIKSSIRQALLRSDIVLISGGLGPTPDDLTMHCIGALLGEELIMDSDVLNGIEHFFRERGMLMPPGNAKQALRPAGAELLANPDGTAPGIIWRIGPELMQRLQSAHGAENVNRTSTLITFPGVPSELKTMWNQTVSGYLERNLVKSTIFSIELKHYGIGESALAEKYASLLHGSNPTVAPYAGRGECRLRVTAKAENIDTARSLAEPLIKEIRAGSGHLLYGIDDDSLESVTARMLRDRGLTVSVAESCTGGLVSKRLTDIAGSSSYISLNMVTYSNEAKRTMLGVEQSILDQYGAVSPECVKAMAEGVRARTNSDIGLAISGVAGPDGGTHDKPVGTVYFGLATEGRYFAHKRLLGTKYPRKEIRYRSANEALNMIRLYLLNVLV
ncbi:MAG: competence/damage-inducible protein A [Cyanobacteria bacterium]|nr:competence/damage-inducible protein A [Cyanobacteriota bacterium]